MLDSFEIKWMVAVAERKLALSRVQRISDLGGLPGREARASRRQQWVASRRRQVAQWLLPAGESISYDERPVCC